MKSNAIYYLLIAFTGLVFTTCEKDDGEDHEPDPTYNPVISVDSFSKSTNLTNPYFPKEAGKKYIYEGETPDGLEHVEEQRLSTTKTIMGIVCIEVEVKEYLDGQLTERTIDWYAQDNSGTVWYFGETVDNYNSDGTVSDHEGSWEAGVDDAKPGIIMPANPQVGTKYREEYLFGEAEDQAEIIGTGLTVTIPLGTYTKCIQTKNWTELEPDVIENKYYAPGIGLIKEVDLEENVEITLKAIL